MANRTGRINLTELPGAEENGVQWLMCCGVRNRSAAVKAAQAFIEDAAKVKKGSPAQLHAQEPSKPKSRSKQ